MIIERIEEVLLFIEEIKDEFKETALYKEFRITPEYFFTRGGCGQFYTILKSAFPQAHAYCDLNYDHVIAEIDGYFYDIEGLVLDMQLATVTPLIEKVVTNFSFSLKSKSWFGSRPGPCDISFKQVIDEMSDEERDQLFSEFKERGEYWFKDAYKRFKAEDIDPEDELAIDYVVIYGAGYAAVV